MCDIEPFSEPLQSHADTVPDSPSGLPAVSGPGLLQYYTEAMAYFQRWFLTRFLVCVCLKQTPVPTALISNRFRAFKISSQVIRSFFYPHMLTRAPPSREYSGREQLQPCNTGWFTSSHQSSYSHTILNFCLDFFFVFEPEGCFGIVQTFHTWSHFPVAALFS